MTLYLDASALVKLVLPEAESGALKEHLDARAPIPLVTSALARVEVPRAVAHGGDDAVALARRVLDELDEIALHTDLLDEAALLPLSVRSLDAIHLVSAGRVGRHLDALVTYDRRMAAAADALGFDVIAPG